MKLVVLVLCLSVVWGLSEEELDPFREMISNGADFEMLHNARRGRDDPSQTITPKTPCNISVTCLIERDEFLLNGGF